MKSTVENYSFVAAARTLKLSSINNFKIERLYAVINLRTNTIIYNVAAAGSGYTGVNGSIVTLAYNTSEMLDTDPLAIIYDYPATESILTGLLERIALKLLARLTFGTSGGMRVEMAANPTVGIASGQTIGTVSAVSAVNAVSGVALGRMNTDGQSIQFTQSVFQAGFRRNLTIS